MTQAKSEFLTVGAQVIPVLLIVLLFEMRTLDIVERTRDLNMRLLLTADVVFKLPASAWPSSASGVRTHLASR